MGSTSFSRLSDEHHQNKIKGANRKELQVKTSGTKYLRDKVKSPKHQTVIYSSEACSPVNNSQRENPNSSQEMNINEEDIVNYLKNHFQILSKNTAEKNSSSKAKNKKLSSRKRAEDISSLPVSVSSSQNHVLDFHKYEEDKLPNGLSSLNDLSSND